MQAFTPFVRVATDATRHFATFGLAPAAAFFIPNPARHPFQGWRWVSILNHTQRKRCTHIRVAKHRRRTDAAHATPAVSTRSHPWLGAHRALPNTPMDLGEAQPWGRSNGLPTPTL